ncbi:CDP-diacylglycerol-glycerol-3-phosphate 3-phosphatidyltransferase [Lophium mytilinum]|uniref:CDP-diacylglycerol--glycerol-3-phosphate 3-phosphatidyltransferase n=1 Tax=Lophium mytilinum TaxID=390894 RepID=A0A6A6Q850_9PEZI|nr:CDP-diacylglycerol-glycerol-3-phosphate 3-phosphatidyltransferase [Lophium mytilinum]
MAAPTPQSNSSLLGAITTELDKISPRFEIQQSQIEILKSPTEFYETLKAKIRKARRRIYLSTLYIGKTEHELISTIREALLKNPNLQVSFLTDALRGTRETPLPSCASLLVPLVAEFGPKRVEIRMFHTPNLTGVRKKVIPRRINEGWGLQHMKLYGVDEELIISGANLSDDYFTNRQDRYHVFSSAEITSYFSKIHSTVCSLSYLIEPSSDPAGYTMAWPTTNPSPSPLENPRAFKSAATTALSPLLTPSNSPSLPSPPTSSPSKTLIYPLLQLTPLLHPDTSTEQPAIHTLLRLLSTPAFAHSRWTFTAGYFNMTPALRRLLLATRPAHATVLAAHPHANGFYNSPGVSGMLPAAYTLLARRFLDYVRHSGQSERIELKEWKRGIVNEAGGWTYHAKGIWVTLPGEEAVGPSVSIVGSSNYTKRSYELDIEAGVAIVTGEEGLKRKLRAEEGWLQEYAKTVGREEFEKPERRVGVTVRLAMWVVRVLGGAL